MKAKTPEELAKEGEDFAKYTLYLNVKTMDYLKQRANKAGTSVSKLVNESIMAYAATIKDKKND